MGDRVAVAMEMAELGGGDPGCGGSRRGTLRSAPAAGVTDQ